MRRSKYASSAFWVDTFDRAVATFAEGTLGALGADGIGIVDADLLGAASIGALAALGAVLYSVAFRGGSEVADG